MSRCDPATLARMIHERDRRGTKFEVPKTSNFGPQTVVRCSEITQVVRVVGAERMDLQYSEGCGKFHSGVQVFLRRLA